MGEFHISERVLLIVEEASEVIQAVTKCERFGYENHHPLHPEGRPNNFDCLIQEIGDFLGVIDLLYEVTEQDLIEARDAKKRKMVALGICSAEDFNTFPKEEKPHD